MAGALEGIRVVEVAHWVATPGACAILSDWGAEVVKVEDPRGGDPARGLMGMGLYPFHLPVSPSFEMDNRNKRSVALNLAHPPAREVVHRLVERCDVFATNLEPEVQQRFSLRYEDLAPLNPRLIYASLSGYGEEGPDTGRPGYDWTAYWARSGIMATLGEPDAPPVAPRPGIGDHPTSLAIAGAVAAALFSREKTGVGQKVSLALFHCGLWQLSIDVEASLISSLPIPRLSRKMSRNPLTIAYQAADGQWLQLTMPQSDRYWGAFCRAVGRPELEPDPRFAASGQRQENAAALIGILDQVFATRTREEWGRLLDQHGLVWGVVQTAADIASDAQAQANQFLTTIPHPVLGQVRLVTSPGKFSGTPSRVRSAAPQLGQHTEEVLLELGYSWEDIARLKEAGATL